MRKDSTRRRAARNAASDKTTPTGLETLEKRTLLSSFIYHDLGDFVDPSDPLFVLRPLGEHASARTVGSAVAGAGDVNGDGRADILVGAGGVVSGMSDSEGAVASIFSGADGSTLFTFSDGFSEFGASVAGVGDVNGDGTPDVIVGSPRFDSDMQGASRQIGRIYLYSGEDGSLLRTFTGESAGDRFGASIFGAGDFNNDGTPDIVVGAPGSDAGGTDRGRAYVYSGVDGTLLAAFTGAEDHDALGYSVAGGADADNDGFDDVIVGAPGRFNGPDRSPGRAYVYSGQTETAIWAVEGDHDGDRFGFAVAFTGDIDGDSRADFIVGAPNADNDEGGHIPGAGQARVFSGATGDALRTFRGELSNGNLGAAVAGAGDVDFDGQADYLIASPSANPRSSVAVYSGASGAKLDDFTASERALESSDRLSTSIAAVGDVNGDGFTDFVFAGTQDANPERNDRARMYVFSGAPAAGLFPEGFNDDLDMWGLAGDEGFLVLNGDLFRLSSRPGFQPGDRVVDVNSHDTVLAMTSDGAPFLWSQGVRMMLSDIIVNEDGPFAFYSGLRGADLTDSGLVLVQRLRANTDLTTWLLEGDTLTYLMDGAPVAMNEARAVIATTSGVNATNLWTPLQGVRSIPDLFGVDINENSTIVGTAPDPANPSSIRTLVWTESGVSNIGAITGGEDFVPTAINNAGEIVGRYTIIGQPALSVFFYTPGDGIVDIRDCLSDADATRLRRTNDSVPVDLNNGGWVLGRHLLESGFLLEPFGSDGPFRADVGGAVAATLSQDGVLSIVSINRAGEIILFQRAGENAPWVAFDLTDAAGADTASSVAAFRDVRAGGVNAYAAITASGVLLISQTSSGEWTIRNLTEEIPGSTGIVRGLVQFTTLDGYATLAGYNESGELVIYGETAQTDSQGRVVWAYDNLSQTQLTPRGIGTPVFVGKPIAYVTSWNGLNIAGVDESGEMQVVWTAPELGGWTATNLTSATGAPVIAGGLTAYVTSWGGINLAGNDAAGDTVVTWWVPGFGGEWRHNNFSQEFGGPRLRSSSLTSYVTSWGGLNVAGLTDDGDVVIYWWVPGFNEWRIAPLAAASSDRRDVPIRNLTSFAGDDGSFHILATGLFGDVLHYHWRPGMEWQVENLTQATA